MLYMKQLLRSAKAAKGLMQKRPHASVSKRQVRAFSKAAMLKAPLQTHIGAPCIFCKPCRALWWPADYCALSCVHSHLWCVSGEDSSAAKQDVCGEAVAGGRVKGCQEPR